MQTIRGVVTKIRYEDRAVPSSNRCIVDIQYETPSGVMYGTAGSYTKGVKVGDFVVADGEWRASSFKGGTGRDNQIFETRFLRPSLPESAEAAIRYLAFLFVGSRGSGDKPFGVTIEAVKKLVAAHGAAVVAKAIEDPELITELGSNPRQKGAIKVEWQRRTSAARAVAVMASCGLDGRVIDRIVGMWRDETLDKIQSNPYESAKLPSVGFANAEKLAVSLDIAVDDHRRLGAAVEEVLRLREGTGSTCADTDTLLAALTDVSGIDKPKLTAFLVEVARNPSLGGGNFLIHMGGDGPVASPVHLLSAEISIANGLARLVRSGKRHDPAKVRSAAAAMFASDKDLARLDPIQRLAIEMAASEPLSIITGGPGTGKSTVMDVVARLADIFDKKDLLFLVAPTGKASKRLSETTRRKAQTLHARLKARGRADNGRQIFGHTRHDRLPAGSVVVVDESSMVDVELMSALAEAMPDDGRIILVGDSGQLPSVSPGAVLADLLGARTANGMAAVPSVALQNVYRSDKDGAIALGAKEIREGRIPTIHPEGVGGVNFLSVDQYRIVDEIERLVCEILPERNISLNDVAILCPQRAGTAGTYEINLRLQKRFNPDGAAIPGVRPGADDDPKMPIPRVGDRVMLTQNDAEKDVMNGDTGIIRGFSKKGSAHTISVSFDCGHDVEIPAAKWRDLIVSYAGTIHRSQGSQYKVVIMPMCMAHENMHERRLLYTGWTRAKSELHLVGQRTAFEKCVRTSSDGLQSTLLRSLVSDWPARFASLPDWQMMLGKLIAVPEVRKVAAAPRTAPPRPPPVIGADFITPAKAPVATSSIPAARTAPPPRRAPIPLIGADAELMRNQAAPNQPPTDAVAKPSVPSRQPLFGIGARPFMPRPPVPGTSQAAQPPSQPTRLPPFRAPSQIGGGPARPMPPRPPVVRTQPEPADAGLPSPGRRG